MKTCKQCKTQFEITDQDRAFYNKMQVPEPSLCSQCSLQRRLAFRNETALYKTNCALCMKETLSVYSQDKPYIVYCVQCYKSDKWSGEDYALPYDFNKSFFAQFYELLRNIPRMAVWHVDENFNCDYSNYIGWSKNVYLSFSMVQNEDCYYCRNTDYSSYAVDCLNCVKCELVYECIDSRNCYASQYLERCADLRDSTLCVDCVDCSNCFGCANLRHKRFCWFNKQLTQAEWNKRYKEFINAPRALREKIIAECRERNAQAIKKFAFLNSVERSTGDSIRNVSNCINCFDGYEGENLKDCFRFVNAKDSHRVSFGGLDSDMAYECLAFNRSHNTIAQMHSNNDTDCVYIDYCDSSSDCFGCSGLRHKKFCILNKQYNQSEYKALKAKIIAQMKEAGEWGEFFPAQISLFGYNETLAYEYFPLSKDEVLKRGWKWADNLPGIFGKETISAAQIPDHIKNTQDSICNEILACKETGQNYKIIKQEMNFYRKFNIPVPTLHPLRRLSKRMARRTPRHLWHRQCMCENPAHDCHDDGAPRHSTASACRRKFETTYAPERPEKVFCEQCYQKEVY